MRGSIPEKYNLSSTACAGILRRAARRGKVLPPLLERALRTRVAQDDPMILTVLDLGLDDIIG